MNETILKFSNVVKSYDRKIALNGISGEIPIGCIVALLGPNGSGKTTLLKGISGLLKIDSGDIYINPKYYQIKTDIQYIFDEPVLYEALTGREHIYFSLQISHKKIERNYIEELIEKFELVEFINNPISTYSLGMKKKIQLVCALVLRPKLMLMDEFISGLDPIAIRIIINMLKKYVSNNTTIVLSTHIIDIAQKMCDKVMIINNGTMNEQTIDMKNILSKGETLENYFFAVLNR